MLTFQIKTRSIEFEKFDRDDKGCVKINIVRDGETEGIWAWIAPKDVTDYQLGKDTSAVRIAIAANQSLTGIPWGHYFPYRLTGPDTRPVCDMNALIDFDAAPLRADHLFD